MKKQILSIMVLILGLVFLVACSGADGSEEMMDSSQSHVINDNSEVEDIYQDPAQLSGIVIMHSDTDSRYQCYNVQLTAIDPSTGDTTGIRTFATNGIEGMHIQISTAPPRQMKAQGFDSSLERVAARRKMPDGASHVGWIDLDGNFFDVSEKISEQSSDFGGLVKHTNPIFGPNDYFYFSIDIGGPGRNEMSICRVSLSTITPENVEVVDDSADGNDFLVHPDGSVKSISSTIYSDETMSYAANGNHLMDWVSENQFVGSIKKDYRLYLHEAAESADDSLFNNSISQTPITPDILDRVNFSAVVSPDKLEVAFLSYLSTGTDQSPSLFVVPVTGGEPAKIGSDYSFSPPSTLETPDTILGWIN